MLLTLLLLVVFLASVAMLWNEGMWSNAVTCVNVALAAMVATNYFEPLAAWLDHQMPSYTYLWDFLALWGLFTVTLSVTRALTDKLSRYRVRFKMPVEQAGRVLLAVWASWMLVCFVTMSLHTAPLALHPFRGSFQQEPLSNNFLGLAPDRQWLAFIHSRSRGALSRGDAQAGSPYAEDAGQRVFDPQGEFILKYGSRRANLEQEPEMRVLRN